MPLLFCRSNPHNFLVKTVHPVARLEHLSFNELAYAEPEPYAARAVFRLGQDPER
jgi:hypothetical protein